MVDLLSPERRVVGKDGGEPRWVAAVAARGVQPIVEMNAVGAIGIAFRGAFLPHNYNQVGGCAAGGSHLWYAAPSAGRGRGQWAPPAAVCARAG
jgi:hypothetical protein